MLYNDNAERLQVQGTDVGDFELDLFNRHARYVSHNIVLRFQDDDAIHRYFGQETLVTTVAML